MKLTREQAAEVWCPMARPGRNLIMVAPLPQNVIRNPQETRCIADQCAMWRWSESLTVWRDKVVPAPEHGVGGKKVIQEPVEVPTLGYCGLAGAPKIAGG